MKMIRNVYHFAGNDYNENDKVTLHFNVLCVSIQNFLKLCIDCKCKTYVISEKVHLHRNVAECDYQMKTVIITAYPYNLAKLLICLGCKEHSEISDYIEVTHRRFRNIRNVERYNGFTCFNPVTKEIAFKSNAPVRVTTQAIVNGCLWRKIYRTSK